MSASTLTAGSPQVKKMIEKPCLICKKVMLRGKPGGFFVCPRCR